MKISTAVSLPDFQSNPVWEVILSSVCQYFCNLMDIFLKQAFLDCASYACSDTPTPAQTCASWSAVLLPVTLPLYTQEKHGSDVGQHFGFRLVQQVFCKTNKGLAEDWSVTFRHVCACSCQNVRHGRRDSQHNYAPAVRKSWHSSPATPQTQSMSVWERAGGGVGKE